MTIDSTDNDQGNSFEYRLKEVSDEEIINILKFREHFQPHAVKAAIKEAMKRGIISSLDDLDNERFKSQPLPPKSLFPLSSIEAQNNAIFKSLCRISYGFSIIPIVFGAFEIANRHFSLAIFALLAGLIVIFLTFRLEKTRKMVFSQMLLFVNLPSVGYATYYLVSLGKPLIMDMFTALVIVLVILYTTLYLHKLNSNFNKNTGR
jgi:hypothetical protein